MSEVLIGEYIDGENCIRSVILESELHGCKGEVMYTPLDLNFLKHILALWRSGENITTILHILYKENNTANIQEV